MGEPLNAQVMSIGKSPFRIEQVAEIASPEFTGSSPNVNGKICGATEKMAATRVTRLSKITEIYIYIYVCGCVCMCVRIGSFSFPRFLVSYDKGEGREEGEWIGIIGIESFFFLFFSVFF